MSDGVDIVWVTSQWLDALERLFARSAGVDGCWCMWPRREPRTHHADRSQNRAAMRALVEAGVEPGLLALVDAKPLGWCALGPLASFPQYAGGSARDWGIACVFVDPEADRDRIMAALLEAAAQEAIAAGAWTLRGPPIRWQAGDTSSAAAIAQGFLDNGFEKLGAGERMPVLIRSLR